jgi:hypothetical protein
LKTSWWLKFLLPNPLLRSRLSNYFSRIKFLAREKTWKKVAGGRCKWRSF